MHRARDYRRIFTDGDHDLDGDKRGDDIDNREQRDDDDHREQRRDHDDDRLDRDTDYGSKYDGDNHEHGDKLYAHDTVYGDFDIYLGDGQRKGLGVG